MELSARLSAPVVVFCISFFLILVTSAPEFTNCPTSPLCINEPVTYQCNVTGSANTVQWRVFNATGGILNAIQYGSGISVGSPGSIGTQFATNLTSRDGGSIVSTITFTTAMDIHNYTVECVAILFDSVSNTISTIGTDNCSILVQDVLPDAPVPTISAINPNNYTVSWPPSTSPCFSSYFVFVNSSVSNVTYTTTDTSLSLPVPSTNDTEYSISVVAVDTGGRSMDQQGIIKFTPNVPPAVTNFAVIQTSPEDDDIVNITVSWNEPSTSSRPNVLSYIVYHNVTDPDTSITIPAPTTAYNIPDATVGSVYTVGVAAVNVLGIGLTASATISIISTVIHVSTTVPVPVTHSATLITTGGTPAAFTSCPTSPLCINEPVTYQCRVDTSGSTNALQWRVLNTIGDILSVVTYVLGSSLGSTGSIGTQFTTNLTSTGGSSIVSNITFTPTMDINNYTIECRALVQSGITFTLVGTSTCPILIQDKPLEEKSWSVSPWNQCFPDCHRGIRNRTVVCMTVSTRMIMDGCSPPPPPSEETCHERGPCTQWVAEPWSVCSKSCGVGYQVRRIKCQATYDSSITLNDSQCLTARPHVFRYCNIHDCPCTEPNFCKLLAGTGLCWRAQYQRICCNTCEHAS